mgnify:CR=1 FL=1
MTPLPLPVNVLQCAPRGLQAPLTRSNAEALTGILKAIADPTRLQLLALINSQDDKAACVCDLAEAVNLTQPTVSHHLRVLTEAGLLHREKKGTWVWYSVDSDRLSTLSALLD